MQVAQAEDAADFVCTLQPRPGSTLAAQFASCRRACQCLGLGVDETSLYPPHVTVTGFFRASDEQAARVCELAAELAASASLAVRSEGSREEKAEGQTSDLAEGRRDVQLLRVLSTDSGHVIADVVAFSVACLAAALAEKARAFGVQLRPKAVRHLSLASGRGSEEQASILSVYGALPLGGGPWDLVVSKLVEKSELACLRQTGQMHQFKELLRLPLPSASAEDCHQLARSAPALHERIAQPCHAAQAGGRRAEGCAPFFPTPMKRRSRGLPSGDWCSDEQVTPPVKLTRRRSQPEEALAK